MHSSALRAKIETALSPKFGVSFSFKEKPVPELIPSGIPQVDLPRGTLAEIYGPASSGKTGLLFATLARATRLPECCVLIDSGDSFRSRQWRGSRNRPESVALDSLRKQCRTCAQSNRFGRPGGPL
jgi:hypothetical protein